MKFAFFNPTAIAVDEVPENLFNKLKTIVGTAHKMHQLNNIGDVKHQQIIRLLPNEFGLDTSELSHYVETKCQEYIDNVMKQSNRTDLVGVKPKMIAADIIKQSTGDYQVIHDRDAHISGSIFIEVPNLNQGSNTSDANLELRLPVIRDPSRFIFVDQCRIVPTLKSMTIFPSFIPHTVYPWQGTGYRTVITWDVILTSD